MFITRGQWPYRLRSTRALSSNYGGFKGLGGLQTASEVKIDLRFVTSNLDYPAIHVHIASIQGYSYDQRLEYVDIDFNVPHTPIVGLGQ